MPSLPSNIAKMDMDYVNAYRCLERTGPGWIEEAGWVHSSHGIPEERRLRAWQVAFVFRGSGWFRDALGNRARIVAGSWYTLFPGVGHAYAPDPGTTWDECFVIFGGPVGKFLESHGVLDRNRPVRQAEPVAYWRARLATVFAEAHDEPPAAPAFRLAAVATELAAAASHVGGWLAQAKRALDPVAGTAEVPLATVARRQGLGAEAFRKRFTRLAGVAPRRWRERRRLEHACELLLDRSRTLRVVAAACGFADEFHLSRRFTAVLGLSPRQWRSRLPV